MPRAMLMDAGRLVATALLLAACSSCSTSGTVVEPLRSETAEPSVCEVGTPDEPAEGRNEGCGEVRDADTRGAACSWRGFVHEGKTYRCNLCPDGKAVVEGRWRAIDFETEDPTVPLNDGTYREVLTFRGNRWHQRSVDSSGGGRQESRLAGWYFCGAPSELANEASVFVVSRVQPEGALGYRSEQVFTGNLLLSQSGNKLDFNFWDGFNRGPNRDSLYCRIGTTVETASGEEKTCGDPFAEGEPGAS